MDDKRARWDPNIVDGASEVLRQVAPRVRVSDEQLDEGGQTDDDCCGPYEGSELLGVHPLHEPRCDGSGDHDAQRQGQGYTPFDEGARV